MREVTGRVTWIGVREPRVPGAGSQAPTASGPMTALDAAEIDTTGLVGDRAKKPGGRRSVSLIQAEHLPVVAALVGAGAIEPAATRRNLVVAGVNLQSLKRRAFTVGEVLLEGSGDCHPCSKMDHTLGAGGHDAMLGHGGITARVLRGGRIRVGDVVAAADPSDASNDQ